MLSVTLTLFLTNIPPFVLGFKKGTLFILVYPHRVPWKLDSTFVRVVTYGIQIPVVVYGWVVIYMLPLHYTFLVLEFQRQYEKLQYAIKTLDERCRKAVSTKNEDMMDVVDRHSEEYSCAFESNLIICIRHHQTLFL